MFTCVVLGLSSLFFVVTGIQFWATDYLITVLKASTPAYGPQAGLTPDPAVSRPTKRA